MTTEIINGLTFEAAAEMVNRTKFKAVNQFKQFATIDFDYEDMMVEADMAILKAWREWDPEQTKFNTHATNMINWMLYRALENHNPVFRMNRQTKMNLNNRGESYKTLKVKKLTADKDFNKLHDLDGIKEFTREHFNSYVYYVTAKTFGFSVKRQSDFYSKTGDEDEFNVFENIVDEKASAAFANVEFAMDMEKLDPVFTKVYDLLESGLTIKEAIEGAGTTKARLKTLYKKAHARKAVPA